MTSFSAVARVRDVTGQAALQKIMQGCWNGGGEGGAGLKPGGARYSTYSKIKVTFLRNALENDFNRHTPQAVLPSRPLLTPRRGHRSAQA